MFKRTSLSSTMLVVLLSSALLYLFLFVGVSLAFGLELSTTTYVALIIAAIVGVGGGFFMGTQLIVSEAKHALSKIQAINSGKTGVDFSDLSENEIGQICAMIQNTYEKNCRMLGELESYIGSAITTSQHLSTANSQAEQGVKRQESDTEHLQTAVDELANSVEEVATHAHTAAESAQEAENEATNGKSVVNFTRESIGSLAEHVQSAADVINKLEEHSNSIGTILDVIRGIAEQTNLLALNAAIEAARAGEQGRGFAVVADEVRTLAQRTQESTQEIQSMIEKLQAGSTEAVTAMNRGREGAEQCLEQANKAGAALEQITNAVGKINDMNMQIAAAAHEQSKVAQAITENVGNIKETTRTTVEVTDLTATASSELNTLAGGLKSFMNSYAN